MGLSTVFIDRSSNRSPASDIFIPAAILTTITIDSITSAIGVPLASLVNTFDAALSRLDVEHHQPPLRDGCPSSPYVATPLFGGPQRTTPPPKRRRDTQVAPEVQANIVDYGQVPVHEEYWTPRKHRDTPLYGFICRHRSYLSQFEVRCQRSRKQLLTILAPKFC